MTDNDRAEQTAADQLRYFPATAPAVFSEPDAARALLAPVLADLAEVVDLADEHLSRPTPCRSYTAGELRDHVLGWLQYFASAMDDPGLERARSDADEYRAAADGRPPAEVVTAAAGTIERAVQGGVAGQRVVMTQAAMDGDAVLAMALGEYLVHGWDLTRATGGRWDPAAEACEHAHQFFAGMITEDYRSAEGAGGMFGPVVDVSEDAPALHRLLAFTGRDPAWSPR